MSPLVECVPNFSEGRNRAVIDAIAQAVTAVPGVTLLDVDPGADTNRTVYTFVGAPAAVSEAAFQAASKAVDLIDMTRHAGAHPRLGSMDVCPIVPVAGMTLEECAAVARALGHRIGDTLGVPVYFYEQAASRDDRRSLATIRAGEYEGLAQKLADPAWAPDAGPARFNPRTGAFIVGAREFLLAYNVNLNTDDRTLAHDIALTIREAGRLRRDATGQVVADDQGQPLRDAGRLKAVRAIGWYLETYRQAQVSINLLDVNTTPLHVVFETVREEAGKRGLLVTGSELVGLTPLAPLLEAGRHYRTQQRKSPGLPERDLVELAVQSLGLGQLAPFDPDQKVIEYRVTPRGPLASLRLDRFVDRVSLGTATPGGGSVAALAGSLAAALAGMVANLTVGKKGYEPAWQTLAASAVRAQRVKDRLLAAVDADAAAYDAVMAAQRLPKDTAAQQGPRATAIEAAARDATRVPLETALAAAEAAALAAEMAAAGNRHSAADAGVAALLAVAAAQGAALNVFANLASIADDEFKTRSTREAARAVQSAHRFATQTLSAVHDTLPVRVEWLPRAGAAPPDA
jgi:glutamate formiminotransferase/formiminotetrahydrofolate cyclodeaminase